MVLVVLLAALLLLFLFLRHHVGVPFLAMIAGLAVYQTCGVPFAEMLHDWVPSADPWWVERGLFTLFVAVVPLIIYLRVGRSGLFGFIRIIESVVFALMLTMLMASPLADVFSFDNISRDLANWIDGIKNIVMVVGIILTYVDVLFYRAS